MNDNDEEQAQSKEAERARANEVRQHEERRLAAERMMREFRKHFGNMPEYEGVLNAIDLYLGIGEERAA